MKKILNILMIGAFALFCESCVVVTDDFLSNYHYDNEDYYSIGDAVITGDVKNIDIDWVAGNITVNPTENAELSISEQMNVSISDSKRMHYWYDERTNTLFIKYCESGTSINLKNIEKDLVVYIPVSMNLIDVTIETVSADINWNNISATYYGITTVSGDNNVSGSYFTYFELTSVSGDLVLNLNDSQTIDFDTVSGDFDLYIPSVLGFHLEKDSVSGDVDFVNIPVSGSKGDYYYGDGRVSINCNSVSGDVMVTSK